MNTILHTSEFISFCKQFSTKERIIIYGASEFAITLNNVLNDKILAFIDRDKDKQKMLYLNKMVLDIENIYKLEYDLIIITVVGKEENIKEFLSKNYNIDQEKIIYFKQIPDIFYIHKYQLYKYEYQLVKNFLIKSNFTNNFKQFIAPGYFLYEYNNCYPLEHVERFLEDFYIKYEDIEYIIIPKSFEMGFLLKQLLSNYQASYSNVSYIVFKLNIIENKISFDIKENNRAAFITTYNRPRYLEKTLNLLEQFEFDDILIVDDCSSEKYKVEYDKVFEKFSNKITVIRNPKNRGLAYSLNTGFSYLIADLSIKWVSYFQDDITYIDKNLYSIYSKYENSQEYPIITGYYGEGHPIIREKYDNNKTIYFLQTTPGVHIHMHRKYINNFLPIPTHFLGAPKKNKHSHTDWWMSNWSLTSPLKYGTEILCIPNLVKTDLSEKNSTYRNIKEK